MFSEIKNIMKSKEKNVNRLSYETQRLFVNSFAPKWICEPNYMKSSRILWIKHWMKSEEDLWTEEIMKSKEDLWTDEYMKFQRCMDQALNEIRRGFVNLGYNGIQTRLVSRQIYEIPKKICEPLNIWIPYIACEPTNIWNSRTNMWTICRMKSMKHLWVQLVA